MGKIWRSDKFSGCDHHTWCDRHGDERVIRHVVVSKGEDRKLQAESHGT